MAPEQVKQQPSDRRADVFSAGVVLYEAITGRGLFRGADEGDTVLNVLVTEIPDPSSIVPGVSPQLDAVAHEALERRRDKRFATAARFREALEEACPPPRPTRSRRSSHGSVARCLLGVARSCKSPWRVRRPALACVGAASGRRSRSCSSSPFARSQPRRWSRFAICLRRLLFRPERLLHCLRPRRRCLPWRPPYGTPPIPRFPGRCPGHARRWPPHSARRSAQKESVCRPMSPADGGPRGLHRGGGAPLPGASRSTARMSRSASLASHRPWTPGAESATARDPGIRCGANDWCDWSMVCCTKLGASGWFGPSTPCSAPQYLRQFFAVCVRLPPPGNASTVAHPPTILAAPRASRKPPSFRARAASPPGACVPAPPSPSYCAPQPIPHRANPTSHA